ncbi:627_t:CDS:1, partial [Entrophospora sp. SA101]
PERIIEFWQAIQDAEIFFSLPPNWNENDLALGPFFLFMTIKGNYVILNKNIMINSNGQLIYNNGKRVMNQDTNEPLQSLPFNSTLKVTVTINMEENMEEEELPDNWGGMLHLPKSTFCIVSNNISMILI